MAHCGWNTPKTAIGYVKKSRMTSYNMSMFFSNVQRQNQDLDTILNKTKPLIGGVRGKVNPGSRLKISALALKEKKKTLVPVVNDKLVSRFSSSVAAAKPAESFGLTRESQIASAQNRSIVSAIEESPGLNSNSSTSSVVEDQLEVESDFLPIHGGGVGGEVGEGEGSGGSVHVNTTSVLSDPRVSSILSNLSNHGQLHVHFHFGGK
jgi:hypothetical protein